MHRFFVSPADINGEWARLNSSQIYHLERVLRLKAGDQIGIFDGEGREYRAILELSGSREIAARIVSRESLDREPWVRLSLIQAVAKGDKMDFIIQKAVELGVADIYPVFSERSVVRLEGDRARKKVDRWQSIAWEACKQCGRSSVPAVHSLQTLTQCLEKMQSQTVVMLYEGSCLEGLGRVLKDKGRHREISVLIGPEGGFSLGEVERARQHGVIIASLGPRILRTETAGLVALSIILYEYGELG